MGVGTPEVAPSILSADFSRLATEIKKVEPWAGRIHIDVMDGHFVPNLSMGPVVVRSIRPITNLPLEVHLMVLEPEKFIDSFVDAGADRLIFHLEVTDQPDHLAERIRKAGISPGLAINPATTWDKAASYVPEMDLMLVMTVNPGFGGQAFLPEVLPKVESAYQTITEGNRVVDIEVDGGIDPSSASRARTAGANVFVAGHSVFRSGDPSEACRALRQVILSEGD